MARVCLACLVCFEDERAHFVKPRCFVWKLDWERDSWCRRCRLAWFRAERRIERAEIREETRRWHEARPLVNYCRTCRTRFEGGAVAANFTMHKKRTGTIVWHWRCNACRAVASEKKVLAHRGYHRKVPREKRRAREALRRASERNAPGRATAAAIAARIAYYDGKCWICGAPWEHVDHVIPLSRGGSNWPANLRPACGSCNVRKGNKKPSELANLRRDWRVKLGKTG